MGFADASLLFISQLVLYNLGAGTITKLLFKDKDSQTQSDPSLLWPRILFAITLSSSCTLFLLVFSEIMGLFSPSVRWQYWQSNLHMLLFLVVILLPFYQVYTFLHHMRGWNRKTSIYAACVAWAAYMYCFTRVAYHTSSIHQQDLSWTELAIFRIGTLGVTFISILSGFGVVNTPYTTLGIFRKPVTQTEYAMAQNAYEQTCTMIEDKRALLARMKEDARLANSDATTESTSSGLLGQFISAAAQGMRRKPQYEQLETEIRQLESLVDMMKMDVDELARERARHVYDHTWIGFGWNLIRHIFTLYCIYKLVVTCFNVLFRRVGSGDPITNMISLVIKHFDRTDIDTAFWSQQLSFWFVGIIIIGSVRGLLQILTKVLRSFSQKVSVSRGNVLLFVAQMMAMYFLSSVLMMQSSLPPDYRHLISSSLGNVEFDFFRRWSDIILVISSLVTLAILYVLHQTRDAKSMATDFAAMQLIAAEGGNHTSNF
ncbi:Abscisic acid G-protein coupled receptor-domain-containing protein [Syncephalastrum racemosum]|uniref:Abscisic acid G-protein coupled receptor-domain-containing protein n=1 Tax=Syncephalastrum racemosum TaxID=13706 RepID=A0A1X2HQC4_SYNRA|nr:Abscisic acid G-protein coupled receptor-domain-containing protein [Syncephalastrum racemosum]